jgi:hypothetical protein
MHAHNCKASDKFGITQNFPKLEGRDPSRPMRQLGHDGACPSTARNFGDFSRNGEVLGITQNFPKLEGRAPSRPMRQLGHDGACPSTARNFGDFSRNGEVLGITRHA